MMNSCCNQREIKKEVCSKSISSIGQTNLDKYALLKSPKGKVTYKVISHMSEIFESKKYQKFFKLLSLIENQLDEPLNFTVEMDYITIEAFRRCGDEEHGYINLKKKLGVQIFKLINDISIRKSTISSGDILDSYLCDSDLDNLREYYEKYEDIVMDCFSKNYSSLCIFNIIYKDKAPAEFLNNIYRSIKSKNECKTKKQYASSLLVEYLTEMQATSSERTREELSYQIVKINKNFNKLCCEQLTTVCIDSRNIIEEIYNLL